MSKKWSQEEIKLLIEQYETNEILWDAKRADYRDRKQKHNVLEAIGVMFMCSGFEVKRKLHNLRNQVSQELKKMKKRQKINGGTDEEFKSNWPYFDLLKFIIPGLTTSAPQSNSEEASSDCEILNNGDICEILEEKPPKIKKARNVGKAKKTPSVSLKRKYEDEEFDDDDLDVKPSIHALENGLSDEYDSFGRFIAMEIRSLRSDFVRRKLKNDIRKAIVCAADEDEACMLSVRNASDNNSQGYHIFVA